MSYPEFQTEEKAVQLMPEDIRILSEYSWDMAGYTSRFGFFYQGNENADIDGLTKWQAEHIFQLTPTPPGMEDAFPDIENGNHIGKEKKKEIIKRNEAVGDTYITQAVKEKNLRYLSFFLHAYESRINAKVYFFLRRNGMDTYDPVQFLDLKLACQEVIPDAMGDLCYEISKAWLATAIQDSLSKLSWRDRTMIQVRNAICWNCGGMQPMKERYSFRNISVQLMNGSSDGGAEKAYNAALTRFAAQLIEDHVIRVVDMKLEKVTRRKKKIVAATYRYQADCDGEWGEIQFDFEKRKAVILQLADWDTSRTKLYSKRVIDRILRTGGNDLPKKERIVFER